MPVAADAGWTIRGPIPRAFEPWLLSAEVAEPDPPDLAVSRGDPSVFRTVDSDDSIFDYFVPTELAAGTRPPNALGVDHDPIPVPYKSKVCPRLK